MTTSAGVTNAGFWRVFVAGIGVIVPHLDSAVSVAGVVLIAPDSLQLPPSATGVCTFGFTVTGVAVLAQA